MDKFWLLKIQANIHDPIFNNNNNEKSDNLNNKETFQMTDESSQTVIWTYPEFWIQS